MPQYQCEDSMRCLDRQRAKEPWQQIKRRNFIFILVIILLVGAGEGAEEVPLERQGGVYTLPVEINGVLTLHFILDTGAAEVNIPADVALTLFRTRTIQDSDFLQGAAYTLADGTTVKSPRFLIRRLKVGSQIINNVIASIGEVSSLLLLGQSFLEKLDSWSLDSRKRVLVIVNNKESEYQSTLNKQVGDITKHSTYNVITSPEVKSFIEHFLAIANQGDVTKLLSLYDNHVDYFDKGIVDKDDIYLDKHNYYKRWTKVTYTLDGNIDVKGTYDMNTKLATFLIHFYVTNSKRSQTIYGKAKNTFRLRKIGGELKIIGEKQWILNKNKTYD